ncbi:hypothetical protein BD324DRAFT_637992 [Kockovaella imperatae]|uniref:Uncharacterized protein n=1 Tax=Kockovaella imperatae TaxID=4999 RepID=A0A1Y1U8Y7_9TREE|nr:hypothetical protein BD324DRAFT_637992 [Kockovaella imperatae]ORX34004.1 hypothetical protein BD324DRAFT_637992 [Kockovaella imperatae]
MLSPSFIHDEGGRQRYWKAQNMTPTLFTTGQSRWALQILVVVLSSIALASSAPAIGGGERMYSGAQGDIRGLTVILASVGIGGVGILRGLSLSLPRPWRIYLDRIEFSLITMLWVCWTSATMAFCAFILRRGMCSLSVSEVDLPTCPLLTFELALLHFISVSCLALLLVILTTVTAPTYLFSLSPSVDDSSEEAQDPESVGIFVMWDLALASPPPSPRIKPSAPNYGATLTDRPSNPYAEIPVAKKDKFADGRVMLYLPLLLGGVGVALGTVWTMIVTRYVVVTGFILSVGILTTVFSASFLAIHYRQRREKSNDDAWILRHDRAMEVGSAGALFLLWPLSAIIYTLFPPTPNRPCMNPATSLDSPLDLPKTRTEILCVIASVTISIAWMASWIILWRIMGLAFPMPEVGRTPSFTGTDEERSLLRSGEMPAPAPRPQVKYGRLVAGEVFELGDDEDD